MPINRYCNFQISFCKYYLIIFYMMGFSPSSEGHCKLVIYRSTLCMMDIIAESSNDDILAWKDTLSYIVACAQLVHKIVIYIFMCLILITVFVGTNFNIWKFLHQLVCLLLLKHLSIHQSQPHVSIVFVLAVIDLLLQSSQIIVLFTRWKLTIILHQISQILVQV